MSDPSWQIRPETPADAAAVEALNDAGFGPGRFAKSAYRLREGVDAVMSLGFVAFEKNELLGSVRFWPISVGGHEELLLGPLAVRGDQRGKGIGIALMQMGIEAAKLGPWRGILLVGDEPYYAKVGFSRLPRWSCAISRSRGRAPRAGSVAQGRRDADGVGPDSPRKN
jgi:predicted N-acetyltransferase YhbS